MKIKEQIISKYDKNSFIEPDWKVMDPRIIDFLSKINKRDHIYTHYSCEGHFNGDSAYLYFIVDEIGFDIFYSKIVPELVERFSYSSDDLVYNLNWTITMKNNKYNSGISINCKLLPSGNLQWFEVQEVFWNSIENIFLKYFI